MTQPPDAGSTRPEVVDERDTEDEPSITQPTKLIRMAAMIRTMLDEVRQAPPDEAGRRRLLEIYRRSLDQIRDVLSVELQEELDHMFLQLQDGERAPSESELRIAQAQLLGWLEGLFHGIQASLYTQQMQAQRHLLEMQGGDGEAGPESGTEPHRYPGVYL